MPASAQTPTPGPARRLDWLWAALLALAFVGAITVPTLRRLQLDCLDNWDLGIYAQALFRVRPGALNPWLSVRDVFIFNDHFDPIVALAAPLAQLFPPAAAAIAIEDFCFLAAGLAAFVFLRRRGRSGGTALTVLALTLFSAGSIKAAQFPSHPTAWAILPLVGLGAALADDSPTAILLSGASLLLFKEEFVFSVFLLGATQWRRHRGSGLWLCGLALAWGGFVFFLRSRLLGPVMPYGDQVIRPWLTTPRAAWQSAFGDRRIWRDLLHLLLPLVPLGAFLFARKLRVPLAVLAIAAAPLAIRLLTGKWEDQYGVIVTGCAVAVALAAAISAGDFPPWLSLGTGALLALMQLQSIVRHDWQTFAGTVANCPAAPARLSELAQARALLATEPDALLVAEGNLIPRLVQRRAIVHLGLHPLPPETGFLLLYERAPNGDPWPLTHAQLAQTVGDLCARGRASVWLDGEDVQLWRVAGLGPEAAPAAAANGAAEAPK